MINRGPVQKDSFFSAFTVGIKTELFEAGEALAEGDFVGVDYSVDTSLTKVYKADADCQYIVGIATEAVAAGANVRVQVKGPYQTANVAGATAEGSLLAKGATPGQAGVVSAATDLPVAVALAADVANVAPVVIL